MKVFTKFDEIPSMILQDIKETKRYGHTVGQSDGHSDNVKTVYPPTNTVCGGYNNISPVAGKSVFSLCDHVRHKPACTASEEARGLKFGI